MIDNYKVICGFISIILFVQISQCQNIEDKLNMCDEMRVEEIERSALVEVDVHNLKVLIPKTLKRQSKKCIDGLCIQFEDSDMLIVFENEMGLTFPVGEKRNPTYREEILLVDGIRVRIWSFMQDGSFKYFSGANYGTLPNHKIGAGIYISSKTKDSRELAKKIFQSVKFKSSSD